MGTGIDTQGCEAIGTQGLVGKVEKGIVTIAGPCGSGHQMNITAARELQGWLAETLSKVETGE